MTEADPKSDPELTKDTPYVTLMGELWDFCCEALEEIDSIIKASHYEFCEI